jgi:hypothetical protein
MTELEEPPYTTIILRTQLL